MIFFLVIVIMLLILFFGGIFLSCNFVYDIAYLDNFNRIQNYKIFQNNEKLFKYYFENTMGKFNQLYGFVPPKFNLVLGNYNFSGLTIYFTGSIFLNNKELYVKSGDFLDYSGNYDLGLKNNSSGWQYFFIDGFTGNFNCLSGIYFQKLGYKKFSRTYTIFSSTGFKLSLISGDYDGGGKKNDIKFSWAFSGNERILDKYYFDIFSGDELLTGKLNGVDYCSGLNCLYTGYNFDTGSYTFKVTAYLTGTLQVCESLQATGSININEN